jgi:uncharacterized protein YndB with AHSA1/START domain
MIEPVVKEVTVPVAPGTAFERFTGGLDLWWPRNTHSVSEAECVSVGVEARMGGALFEVDRTGARHVWGTIQAWAPPQGLSFTWHPGRSPDTAQLVRVTFEPHSEGTRVRLEHRGWEALGDEAQTMRDRYLRGWTVVLGDYVGSFEAHASLGGSS